MRLTLAITLLLILAAGCEKTIHEARTNTIL
jgi:hypothetical protein